MDNENKKEWTEPALIVLTRTNPQEAVLCHCKHSEGGTGPVATGCTEHRDSKLHPHCKENEGS